MGSSNGAGKGLIIQKDVQSVRCGICALTSVSGIWNQLSHGTFYENRS